MRPLLSLWRWITRPRIAPAIQFELHVFVSEANKVGVFPGNVTRGEAERIYPAVLVRIMERMARDVPPDILLHAILKACGVRLEEVPPR